MVGILSCSGWLAHLTRRGILIDLFESDATKNVWTAICMVGTYDPYCAPAIPFQAGKCCANEIHVPHAVKLSSSSTTSALELRNGGFAFRKAPRVLLAPPDGRSSCVPEQTRGKPPQGRARLRNPRARASAAAR